MQPLLSADFVNMPQALSREKVVAVAASLQLGLPQEAIATREKISERQVRQIKHNLVVYGSTHKPKAKRQGRLPKITSEMEEVKMCLIVI